jgi:ketosteroid isomerase-like protein
LIAERFRSQWIQPQARNRTQAGWANDRGTESSTRAGLSQHPVFLERCTDDIEFLANAPIDILPHMGHRRGKAEMREMWEAVRARYSELRCEVPMLVVDGDKAAAFVRVFFRKNINQRMVQFDVAGFYALRDGKISHIREIIDTFDLVQQLLERDVTAILTGRRPNLI